MFQLFKVIRVSIYVGTLFLFQNCSSQLPSIWVLRDVQSLDAKVMSTVQWLKIEKSNVKFYVDCGTNYGLCILLIEEKINYLKIKTNNIILKKISQMAKKNKVLLNPKFDIVHLTK